MFSIRYKGYLIVKTDTTYGPQYRPVYKVYPSGEGFFTSLKECKEYINRVEREVQHGER